LIDTTAALPYLKTAEGRQALATNCNSVSTIEESAALRDIVHSLYHRDAVTIVTNSPHGYARNMLKKHGYPSDLPIVAATGKPNADKMKRRAREIGVSPGDILMIGDAVTDIIAAHECDMPSVGVAWGYSSRKQLLCAEPNLVIADEDNLDDLVITFEQGLIEHDPPKRPSKYSFGQPGSDVFPFLELNLDTYKPWNSRSFDDFSNKILRFKEMKDITLEQLNAGKRSRYYYAGKVRDGDKFVDVFWYFVKKTRVLLDQCGLSEAHIVPVPNSLPSYAYRLNANRLLASNLKRGPLVNGNLVERVYPKDAAHLGGNRGGHFETIGILEDFIPDNIGNVVLIDDIRTTGTQMQQLAQILDQFGVGVKFHGFTLGRTA